MIKQLLLTAALLAPGLAYGQVSDPAPLDPPVIPAPAAGFLYRQGTQLMLNGAPYYMVGFNADTMGDNWDGVTTSDMNSYFAAMRPNSITRIFMTDKYPDTNLDTVVSIAASYNQMLVVSLGDGANNNDMTGGQPNDAWYAGTGSPNYTTYYQPHVQRVVSKYANSKTIAMWEIGNEMTPSNTNDLAYTFFSTMAAYIKSLDPNHLVATGSMPDYSYGGYSNYQHIFSSPNIDVMNIHEYDYDYQNSQTIVSHWYTADLPAAQANNKVFMVGETGIQYPNSGTSMTLQKRSDAFSQKFNAYVTNGGGNLALIWSWRRTPDGSSGNNIIQSDPTFQMVHDYTLP